MPEALVSNTHDFLSLILQADHHIKQQPDDSETYASLTRPENIDKPIEDVGRVAYIEEFSNMSLMINNGTGGEVHYPLPAIGSNSIAISSKLNELELSILKQRGALSLPPKELCDELVDAYFKWVAPIV